MTTSLGDLLPPETCRPGISTRRARRRLHRSRCRRRLGCRIRNAIGAGIGNKPGGDLISSGAFTGVRLADALALAGGVGARARGLYFMGLDGYPSLQSVALARRDEVMLVHGLNGEPLTPDHGAPVRLLVPGHYGMYSVKWLHSITATREFGTFGALGGLTTAVVGPTGTTSHIDTVEGAVAGEPVIVSGLAVSAGLGIARIEVRDVSAGGAWRPAEVIVFEHIEGETAVDDVPYFDALEIALALEWSNGPSANLHLRLELDVPLTPDNPFTVLGTIPRLVFGGSFALR